MYIVKSKSDTMANEIGQIKIDTQDKTADIWDAFNVITAKVWHSKAGIDSKSFITSQAERVIMEIIEGKKATKGEKK